MCKSAENENVKNPNKYELVIGVAKRARQITEKYADGREILVEKPVLLAAEEFKENRYLIKEHDVDD